MRYLLETALLKILGGMFRILPRVTALALGRHLGMLAWILGSERRRLTLKNLDMALGKEMTPGELEKIGRQSFRNLGMNIAEFFRFPCLTPESVFSSITIEGENHLDEALKKGRGVFILSAHMGNWDLMGAAMAMRGYPVALITKTSRSEAVNRIWMKFRSDRGVKMLKGRGTMKESLKHLKEGGMVGFVLDQNARLTEGVFVPFFGIQACTLTSLAVLARRTGSPVLPIHTYRTEKGHRVIIEEPLEHDQLPDQDQDIIERTREYVRWTEKVIRLHPEQWTWLHDRWKTRPKV